MAHPSLWVTGIVQWRVAMSIAECPLWVADSTGRCNTLITA